MNFKPLYDRVLIEPIESADQTKAGFYVPDVAKEKPREGLVVAVGEYSSRSIAGRAVEDDKPHIKVGDKVLFGKFSGSELEVGGKAYIIMREEDIFGTLEKE